MLYVVTVAEIELKDLANNNRQYPFSSDQLSSIILDNPTVI